MFLRLRVFVIWFNELEHMQFGRETAVLWRKMAPPSVRSEDVWHKFEPLYDV
jgi:hypothetical protein